LVAVLLAEGRTLETAYLTEVYRRHGRYGFIASRHCGATGTKFSRHGECHSMSLSHFTEERTLPTHD
jgi:hypothetical protein